MRRMEFPPLETFGGGVSKAVWSTEPEVAGAMKLVRADVEKRFCECSGE
jgi:hypothetical protein